MDRGRLGKPAKGFAMVCGREAAIGGVALCVGLASLGCYSSSAIGARQTVMAAPAARLRAIPDIEPNPPLRIPDPPRASRTEEVLLASAAPPQPTSAPSARQPDPPPMSSAPVVVGDMSSSEPLKELRRLHKLAAEQYAKMDSYIARLRRREQVGTKQNPEEVLCFKFRKDPWSISLKWLSAEGKGREVVYVKGKYENKLHTLLAAGDMPLMPAGKRIALPVDSMLVKSASRHEITDAGIGALIDHFAVAVAIAEGGDAKRGSLTYLGTQSRPEFTTPHEAAEQLIPVGGEPTLPRGGRRLWYFDPENHLPALVITYDDAKKEVEYYFYDRFQFPVKLDEDDFNPEKMGVAKP
jgi:hypothetical protein